MPSHFTDMPKKFLYMSLFTALFTVSSMRAQAPLMFDPYAREPLPLGAPTWMREIVDDPSRVNFRKMETLFNEWLATHINARVKTLDKKPAVNFYRRWMKAYRSYVGPDRSEEHTSELQQRQYL